MLNKLIAKKQIKTLRLYDGRKKKKNSKDQMYPYKERN